MTYFHPRDFDAGQPMIPGLSRFRKFKSYVGIEDTLYKLSNLLDIEGFNRIKKLNFYVEIQL